MVFKATPDTAQRRLELIYTRNCRESEQSLALYLERVIIDCLPQPQPFGEVSEWWQKERDQRLVPAVEFIAGINEEYKGPMNFWESLSKGHDKTAYEGRLLSWLLAFAPRKGIRAFVGAKDSEQAGILRDSMVKEASLNPWYADRLDFTRKTVRGKRNESELFILASDAAGSQGKNPDWVVCDELTVWDNKEFFEALYSGVGKRGDRTGRQRCLFTIITNAGYLDSWQDDVRKTALEETGKSWSYYSQPEGKLLASWISEEAVNNNCKMLSEGEAKRLWRNTWVDLSEERGLFNPEDVDACIGEPTPPPPGATVFLSVDYGEVKDRTCLCEMWFDGEVIQVTDCTVFQGSNLFPVLISDVELWIDRKLNTHPTAVVILDKHQLVGSEQRLFQRGVWVKRFQYDGGKNNYAMAENMKSLLANKQIRFSAKAGLHPDGTTLADEFKKIIYKKMVYGYRLDHTANEHDDRVTAVAMGALEAIKSSPPPPVSQLRPKPTTITINEVKRPFGGGFGGRELFTNRGLYGT